MAVYFFYGDEDYNIDLEVEKLKSALNPDFISMNYHFFDNPDYSDLINALRTPPMMFGKTLIVINSEKYFAGNKNYFEDSELDDIENALSNNPNDLDIVFVLKLPRDENKKPDSRRKLFKILSKFNVQVFNTFSTFYPKEIIAWVKARGKVKGISLKDDAAELLVEQIGNNLRQFDVELDKLKLIAYPEKTVSLKMVEEISISNQDVFNITRFLMTGEKDRALLEFQKLLSRKHPLEILSVIQTMLRQWIIVKSTPAIQDIMKMTGIHNENRISYMKKDLKNVKLKDLVKLKENLFNVEYRIKAGEVLDINSEVESALIR